MKFFASFFLLAGTLAAAASPLDDKELAFEQALKAAPASPTAATGRPFPVDPSTLATVLHQQNPAMIENVVRQLMATHSSAAVQSAGNDLLSALEEEQTDKAKDYTGKAIALLAEAKDTIVGAKKPSDLDGLLADLPPLTAESNQGGYSDPDTMALAQKVGLVQQFVETWQDYLSASTTGRSDVAYQALERILGNPQFTALGFFPRSEILLRRDGPPPAPTPAASDGKSQADQINDLLSKAKTLDDVFAAINQIQTMPNGAAQVTDLSTLQKQRVDVVAGLPVTLDLKAAVSGQTYGDDVSRIEGMELLVILPYYLETNASNPPKPGETVDEYLDRVATAADAAENLALLQRTLAVKIGLEQAQNPNVARWPAQFLGGLSQEAAGQYEEAVVSYETSLKGDVSADNAPFVGHRLAAIKAAHPDDFDKGLAEFSTPLPTAQPGYPGNPLAQQMAYQRAMMFRSQGASALPIPMTISIPGRDASHGPASDNK
jgi:hypothetical protein